MKNKSESPLSTGLQLPLRDLIRGISNTAVLTEDSLKPVATLLPSSIQSTFLSVLREFENSLESIGEMQIDQQYINIASEFILGTNRSLNALVKTASVFGLAWDRLKIRMSCNENLMYSEVITAKHLRKFNEANIDDPYHRAANILLELINSKSIGRIPGVNNTMDKFSEQKRDFFLWSTVIWLLAPRTDSFFEEMKLLELASALVVALLPNKVQSNVETTAEKLEHISQHL